MTDGLKQFKGAKAKQTALKVQLSFRKKVFIVTNLFSSFSHNRQAFSVSQLKENLLKLLLPHEEQSSITYDMLIENPGLLVYKRIEHLLYLSDGKMIWFTGTAVGYNIDNTAYDCL